MTEMVARTSRMALEWTGLKHFSHPNRLALMLLIALMLFSSDLRPLIFSAMTDAYLAVTVFVAATLAIFYFLEYALGIDLGEKMAKAKLWQAPIASFLGALPGCGGAIIVVTQYTKGMISFGSLVAVLIATMGDAAFLLLAREPLTGAGVLLTGFVVGTLSGWFVDKVHGSDFLRAEAAIDKNKSQVQDLTRDPQNNNLRAKIKSDFPSNKSSAASSDKVETNQFKKTSLSSLTQSSRLTLWAFNNLWVLLIVPATVVGLALSFQVDVDQYFGKYAAYEPTTLLGVTGAMLCLLLWVFTPPAQGHIGQELGDESLDIKTRVIKDTNFVTSWVVFGFLAYELGSHFAGSGIETWFKTWAPIVPLVAIIIGFIPGCGPQIVVTTMYLNGVVPIAALYGNAIANDGDALFPAIALAPKAALFATLYSALPALIIAYGIYFLT